VEGAWPADDLTVGEFVARTSGRVPEPGERLDIWELPVEIESVESGRIASVIVAPPRLDDEENDEDHDEEVGEA
jgi:CBS domain containing-hemolysin-like protein